MSSINQMLIKAIEKIIDKKLVNLHYDRTFPSVVYKVNSDKTYEICMEGNLYTVPCAIGTTLKVTQNVWVTIPSGSKNFKDMYISGIRGNVTK